MINHHVVRLYISVHDAFAVTKVQCLLTLATLELPVYLYIIPSGAHKYKIEHRNQ